MRKQTPRQRFQEIVGVFAKDGLKEGITSPARLRQALEELGPTFVKIAQILSTRPDIVSAPYIEEFQKLQDKVKPEEFSAVLKIVETELGDSLENLFSWFNPEPIASASIAQVHQGRLKDGTEVVIKVKRPGIEETIFNDLKLLKQAARIAKFLPQGSVWNPSAVVDELWDSLTLELNFLQEAENIKLFRTLHQDIKYIAIPELYPDYSTRDILVMEHIAGIKVSDKLALTAAGYDLEEIATKIVYNFMGQVFEHGIFHADLHPGNILISANKIAYLDFGLVGKLNEGLRKKFEQLLLSIMDGDLDGILNAIIHIGIKKGSLNRSLLYGEIEGLYNTYITASVYDLDIPHLFEEIFRICRQHQIAFPRDITLLIKGFLVLEGLVNRLAPGMAIIDLIAPYLRRQLIKAKNLNQQLLDHAARLHKLARTVLRLPDKTLEILNKVAAGTIKIQLEHLHLKEFTADINRSVNRLVFALILSSLIIGASLVTAAEVGPKVFAISVLGLGGYLSVALIGLWLLISILRSGRI